MYPESQVQAEVQDCLALARRLEIELAEGDRLIAARAAVDLARAYDRALDNLRLPRFSLQEAQSLRGQLAPVADLLRKCRLR